MKKFQVILISMMLFFSSSVLCIFASDKNLDQNPPPPAPFFGLPPFQGPPPFEKEGQKVFGKEKRWGELKDGLGLSDEQLEKIKSAEELEKNEVGPLFKKLSSDLKILREKVKAGSKDAELKLVLETIKGNMRNLGESREKWEGIFDGLLTPLQQDKMILAGPRWIGFPPPSTEGSIKNSHKANNPVVGQFTKSDAP